MVEEVEITYSNFRITIISNKQVVYKIIMHSSSSIVIKHIP